MDKLSYALGLGIGQQLAQMGAGSDLNVDDFAQSIKDVLAGKELKVWKREAQQLVQE
jgi:FKBP-type peptidyl-prolyl cis-trans isomerase FklB